MERCYCVIRLFALYITLYLTVYFAQQGLITVINTAHCSQATGLKLYCPSIDWRRKAMQRLKTVVLSSPRKCINYSV